jgi:hypothetical protein
MAAKYRKKIEFLLVYVREAHSTDGWQVEANEKEKILLESAKNYEQKEEHATSCVRNLGIQFPALVDGMDNAVEKAYSGWPDRLYLVGKDGRILFKAGVGPGGFKPDQLEAAIGKLPGR